MTKFIDYSYQDICDLTESIIVQMTLSEWKPTIIVGLSRGGLVPAVMISNALSIEMEPLKVSLRDSRFGPTSTFLPELIHKGDKFLIVDDINDTGETQLWIRDDWMKTIKHYKGYESGNWPSHMVKFANLIHNEASQCESDYCGKIINKEKDPHWVRFYWEIWNEKK